MAFPIKLIRSFTHKPPEGLYYEVDQFKRDTFRIWICYSNKFVYAEGKDVKCIWGFWKSKTNEFFSPLNSSTVGKRVNFNDTTSWSSMQVNYSGVEKFFK